MNTSQIQQEISRLLSEIIRLNTQITTRAEAPAPVELELFKSKVTTLYDKVMTFELQLEVRSMSQSLQSERNQEADTVASAPMPKVQEPVITQSPIVEKVKMSEPVYTAQAQPIVNAAVPAKEVIAENLVSEIKQPVSHVTISVQAIPQAVAPESPIIVANGATSRLDRFKNMFVPMDGSVQEPTPQAIRQNPASVPLEVTNENPSPAVRPQMSQETPRTNIPQRNSYQINSELVTVDHTGSMVADKYTKPETLHDRLSRTSTETNTINRIQKQPISDLKAAIGINERFLIISEIFKGDHKAFSEFVEHINSRCANLDEAMDYIEVNIKTQYRWNIRSGVVFDLTDLIVRRFAKE